MQSRGRRNGSLVQVIIVQRPTDHHLAIVCEFVCWLRSYVYYLLSFLASVFVIIISFILSTVRSKLYNRRINTYNKSYDQQEEGNSSPTLSTCIDPKHKQRWNL